MNKTIVEQIQAMGWYMRDPNMDGFTQWGKKQELYKILWEAQKQLDSAPKFYGEVEWLEENGR
jgi:hypothetical protein